MKKLTCILLSLVICILMAVPSFANETIKTEPITLMSSMDAYANDIVKAYIDVNVKVFSSGDNYYLSQGFCFGNDTQTCVYFLFNNEKCVGKLNVAKINDEYVSSFVYGEIPVITDAFSNNDKIALITDKNSVFVISDNYIESIYGPKNVSYVNNIAFDRNEIDYHGITRSILIIESPTNLQNRSSNSSAELDVDIVANTVSPDDNSGLCWAACIASVVRYRKPSVGNLDTLDVYNDLKERYDPATYGYPVGNRTFEQRAFNIYYGYSISYTSPTSGMNYQAVATQIDSNRPIFAAIRGVYISTGETAGHGVVICGYGLGSARPYYRLMDPNEDNIVTVFINSGSSTHFTYTAYGYSFTEWMRSHY